jgi:hypothetical protein
MKCIIYIDMNYSTISIYIQPKNHKTISYHNNSTGLYHFLDDLPQSFHCRLHWVLRVDLAGLNTKIRKCFAISSICWKRTEAKWLILKIFKCFSSLKGAIFFQQNYCSKIFIYVHISINLYIFLFFSFKHFCKVW